MNTFYKIVATGLGTGYSPLAPGTAGAILASFITWILSCYYPDRIVYYILGSFILLFSCLGAYAAKKLEPEWGEDPGKIVIDEIVGVWIVILFIPINLKTIFLAFVLFRIFDIWKPLGIRKAESIGKGWGVMLDDIVAGIYAWICLFLIVRYVF